MQCGSCSTEVLPTWKAAISKNICPACGESILNEGLKPILELLLDNKELLKEIQNGPENLIDWIAFTFDVKKQIHQNQFSAQSQSNDIDTSNIRMGNSSISKFAKAAGVDKILNNPRIANVQSALANINSGINEQQMIEEQDDEIFVDEQELKKEEESNVSAIIAKAKSQGKKVRLADLLANSEPLFDNSFSNAEQEDFEERESRGSRATETDIDTLSTLPQALQEDRIKRLQAQKALGAGGSFGMNAKSAGFRRA